MSTFKKYGWQRDLPDQRDFKYAALASITLPSFVDLRSKGQLPAVYDQGQLGSCTANAVAGASEFLWMKVGQKITPSRLFIYYNERVIEGTVKQDSGASLRDGIKTLSQYGVVPESEWPYVISKFANKPTAKVYADAVKHKALVYRSVSQNLTDMKSVLASGYPFVIGISVYESFESDAVAASGIVPMPAQNEQLMGGHALLVVGYRNSTSSFIVRNSWGSNWGEKGYCHIPFSYLLNSDLADDFWVVTSEN